MSFPRPEPPHTDSLLSAAAIFPADCQWFIKYSPSYIDMTTYWHENVETENRAGSAAGEDYLVILTAVALGKASPIIDTMASRKVLQTKLIHVIGHDVTAVGRKWCRSDFGCNTDLFTDDRLGKTRYC